MWESHLALDFVNNFPPKTLRWTLLDFASCRFRTRHRVIQPWCRLRVHLTEGACGLAVALLWVWDLITYLGKPPLPFSTSKALSTTARFRLLDTTTTQSTPNHDHPYSFSANNMPIPENEHSGFKLVFACNVSLAGGAEEYSMTRYVPIL